MENYIVINGKKAELTDEQLEKLGIKVESQNPFERVERANRYWYIGIVNNAICSNDMRYELDNNMYDNTNYFNDKNFAQQVALQQLLYRKLLKYAYENDAKDCDWTDSSMKYFISKDTEDNEIVVNFDLTLKHSCVVYFTSEEVAEQAIEDVVKPFMKEHPEFVW